MSADLIFNSDRASIRKAAISLAEKITAENTEAAAKKQKKVAKYKASRDYYVGENYRVIMVLLALVGCGVCLVMWYSHCARVDLKLRQKALKTEEKYSDDLLDDNIRKAVQEARALLDSDHFLSVVYRMVADLPIVSILGEYEMIFRRALHDALQQHIYVGLICALIVASMCICTLMLIKYTCTRQLWRG